MQMHNCMGFWSKLPSSTTLRTSVLSLTTYLRSKKVPLPSFDSLRWNVTAANHPDSRDLIGLFRYRIIIYFRSAYLMKCLGVRWFMLQVIVQDKSCTISVKDIKNLVKNSRTKLMSRILFISRFIFDFFTVLWFFFYNMQPPEMLFLVFVSLCFGARTVRFRCMISCLFALFTFCQEEVTK